MFVAGYQLRALKPLQWQQLIAKSSWMKQQLCLFKVCLNTVRHHKSQHHIKVLSFSFDAGPQSLLPLLIMVCSKSASPDLHQSLLQVTDGLFVHALLHAARNLVG